MSFVMAGLVPTIHLRLHHQKLYARVKPGRVVRGEGQLCVYHFSPNGRISISKVQALRGWL